MTSDPNPFRRAGTLLLSGLLACLPAIANPAPAARDLDRILAVVNDDIITESEMNTRLAQTKRQLAAEKIKVPPDALLRKQLLERMVLERLQLQLAERAGIRVSEAEVDRALESIARSNKLSPAEFQKTLGREGIDPAAHRNLIRMQVTIRQLLEREIANRITVTESEVANFLENHEGRAGLNVEYNLSHIFIAIPEAASPEAIQTAKQRAEDVRRQLRQGGNFEQLAVAHSQGPDALHGGNLGWKKAGQLPELFLAILKELPTGAVSEAVRGPNGFHLLRLNDKRGDVRTAPVTQTRVRHILTRPSEIQSLEEARLKLEQLKNRIEHGEDFAALARAHSEDTASAASGGDLGWVNPGQLVPEFEKTMNALKPGQISTPVRSPFGMHLIQVQERRTHDISQERLQAAARQQIHARKADERYEQWMRQLRDEAFVEYFLEDVN
jgi:peptidyl-prolyl cis-trans isomerase SurA